VITASSLREKIHEILPRTARPARYTGGELNSIRKPPHEVSVRFALAFPDVYEIGMSNLGLRILYEALNAQPLVAAERVFAPASDMEDEMRRAGIPLFSLESSLPVRAFDVVGFSLAYELTYTTVLHMLDLAGVSVFSKDRTDDEPIVIAGGHCATNPEPMAEFIDAFAIGDGEEVVVDIAKAVLAHKGDRNAILEALARIEGVYVPAVHGPKTVIRSRIVRDLDSAPYPLKPIVPLVESVHDRAALEIMRGCSRGCRFCQAGMITRPVRERSLALLTEQAREIVDRSGYDEIALTSLSSADYTRINELVRTIIDTHGEDKIGVSLPSLRADASCVALAAEIQRVRKSGLTFAPEAGTQRLRDVINKNVTDDDLLGAVDAAVAQGWKRVKLYFMIGLPTETDDDIAGIADLVRRVVEVGRSHRVSLAVNVTISPFVPKPHTPFQWRAMDSIEQIHSKIAFLRPLLKIKNVNMNWHEPASSQIEAALARGDRQVSKAIYNAWKHGSKLEQEGFDAARWHEAFHEAGLEAAHYANRGIAADEALPWDRIDVGVTKQFLAAENVRADRAEITQDCRAGKCTGCGVGRRMAPGGCPPKTAAESDIPHETTAARTRPSYGIRERLLFRFAKTEDARWLGHLDLIRLFERAIRMSGVEVTYTEGFNPRVKMSIASALPLGATADREILVLNVMGPVDLKDVVSALDRALPDGIRIREAVILPEGSKGPCVRADEFKLSISLPDDCPIEALEAAVQSILGMETIPWQRKSDKASKHIDLRPGIESLEVCPRSDSRADIQVVLPHREFTVKPSEVFELIREQVPGTELVLVHRLDLLLEDRRITHIERNANKKGGDRVCPKR
jgi:radical SAM family uncharacterized protein/radical SAM-linked protein